MCPLPQSDPDTPSRERPKVMDCVPLPSHSWWLGGVVHHIGKTVKESLFPATSPETLIAWREDLQVERPRLQSTSPSHALCVQLVAAGLGHCLLIPFTEVETLLSFCSLMLTTSPNWSSKSGWASDLQGSELNLMSCCESRWRRESYLAQSSPAVPSAAILLSLFLTGSPHESQVHGGWWCSPTISGSQAPPLTHGASVSYLCSEIRYKRCISCDPDSKAVVVFLL